MDRRGFTLMEIVIAVAIVAIFAAAISPMVFKHLEDAKLTRAQNETESIATAVLSYYKDTGTWPYTNVNGPTGNAVTRAVSSANVATGAGTGAGAGVARQIGHAGRQHVAVGLAGRLHGADPEVARRALDAHGDLAAVGDQQLPDRGHAQTSISHRGSPGSSTDSLSTR